MGKRKAVSPLCPRVTVGLAWEEGQEWGRDRRHCIGFISNRQSEVWLAEDISTWHFHLASASLSGAFACCPETPKRSLSNSQQDKLAAGGEGD